MPNPHDHFSPRHYESTFASGPFHFLNPTSRYLPVGKRPGSSAEGGEVAEHKPESNVSYIWRSRDNRKGRHAIVIDPTVHKDEKHDTPGPTDTLKATLRNIGKMFVRAPVWDVSYDVAVVFTIGSVIWVMNGFFSWLPLAAPSSEFSGESTWGGGITAIVGATIFEIGSVLLMLEAVNENRSDCFGWALEDSVSDLLRIHTDTECRHHHVQKGGFLQSSPPPADDPRDDRAAEDAARNRRSWSWWPTTYELRTHYIRDIGFLACSSQMFGATVFWIAGITSIAPILNNLSVPVMNGVYWLPQVVGGTGFIVSSALFMVEVQERWYIPAPKVLGWHIGFWNLIGAIGFTLCGALGFGGESTAIQYALTLSSFIGSWAFLIGSVIQWFESLDKYPIWVEAKGQRFGGMEASS